MDTDEALALGLARDLDASFEALVLAHQDRLYTIAHRFLGNGHDAEEVTQDALVRAYRAMSGYEPDRIRRLRLRPWLATIVLNLCRNRLARSANARGTLSLDRESVDALVAGADVVVHLAFIIFGDHDEAHRVNLEGSRNVFEAAAAAGARRLVYTSSVAAYGFDEGDRGWLTEDMPAAGSEGFYYSAHKAELEDVLAEALAGSSTGAYVFRPCIVAGAKNT